MKKSIFKKWQFWLIVFLTFVLTAVIVIITSGGAVISDSPKNEPVISKQESQESIAEDNKHAAWDAVDYYCRETKEWSATEFNLQKVDIQGNQYYVYVNRDMTDGSTGTFLYIVEPIDSDDNGNVEQFRLVEDIGYIV
ncbi:MAG: hypothetical protein ACLSU9_10820 [Anaerovoracaceae bacterium]